MLNLVNKAYSDPILRRKGVRTNNIIVGNYYFPRFYRATQPSVLHENNPQPVNTSSPPFKRSNNKYVYQTINVKLYLIFLKVIFYLVIIHQPSELLFCYAHEGSSLSLCSRSAICIFNNCILGDFLNLSKKTESI